MRGEDSLIRRTKRWIGFLVFCWGAITIGIIKDFASLSGIRLLLGGFEAGEPSVFGYMALVMATNLIGFQKGSLSWSSILPNVLVSIRGTFSTHRLFSGLCHVGRCLRWRHCICCWTYERHQWIVGLAMAFRPGRHTLMRSRSRRLAGVVRLSRIGSVAYR